MVSPLSYKAAVFILLDSNLNRMIEEIAALAYTIIGLSPSLVYSMNIPIEFHNIYCISSTFKFAAYSVSLTITTEVSVDFLSYWY